MTNFVALDVGVARIGVAVANDIARLAQPLPALVHDDQITSSVQQLLATHQTETLIIGLPRSLDGQDTAQTAYVRQFAADLSAQLSVTITWQDEALTSVKAEEELTRRGKPYSKGDIDSLSAVYILEDYLNEVH